MCCAIKFEFKFGMGMTDRIALRKSTGDYRDTQGREGETESFVFFASFASSRFVFWIHRTQKKGEPSPSALAGEQGEGGGMSSFWFLVSGTVFFLCAAGWGQTQPAGELLQSKAAMPGYGAEAVSDCHGPDEIVSVLAKWGGGDLQAGGVAGGGGAGGYARRAGFMRGSGLVGG